MQYNKIYEINSLVLISTKLEKSPNKDNRSSCLFFLYFSTSYLCTPSCMNVHWSDKSSKILGIMTVVTLPSPNIIMKT